MAQAISRPCLTAASSAILFVVRPTWREKPKIHRPQWSRNTPPVPARLGFPSALPSVLSLRKGYGGVCHLIMWGIRLEVWWTALARKWNSVAAYTDEHIRECWEWDWWLKILSLQASQSFQQVKGKKTCHGMKWGKIALSNVALYRNQSCKGIPKKDRGNIPGDWYQISLA